MPSEGHVLKLSWTNIYVQFSLPEPERLKLDAFLFEQNISLGIVFQRALAECLLEAGVDPVCLQRPSDEQADHDHHAPAGGR